MLPHPGSVFDDLDFCARLAAPTAMVLEEPLEGHILKSAYAKQAALNGAISTSAKGHYEEEVQREIEAIDAIGDYRARSSVGARLPDDRMLSERKEFLESDQRKILKLLDADRINLVMGDEDQLHPEQSTSAIIVHHPQAKYFNI